MTELVAAGLPPGEVLAAARRSFAPWPRFGLRWSLRPGYAMQIEGDGFVVRPLPRFGASPLFEAWCRPRPEGGAAVEPRPMALAYMPLVLANSVVLCGVFSATLLLAARSDIQLWIQLSGIGVVILFVLALAAQLFVMAIFEWVFGARQRAALLAVLRERLEAGGYEGAAAGR